jgi:hypothetical protein
MEAARPGTNDRPRRERRPGLSPRRELLAATLVFGGIVVPFGLGALFGPLPAELPLEGRAAGVVALASFFALGALAVQEEQRQRRRLVIALGAVPLLHLALFGSAAAAALDCLVFALAALVVTLRAPARVLLRPHGSSPRRRFSWLVMMVLALPGPLFTACWGLTETIVVPALARPLHPPPPLDAGARAADFRTEDGLQVAATYWPGSTDRGVVLVHGLHDGRDRVAGWARRLRGEGAHVLAYDQRAHGASEGAVVTFAGREPGDLVHAVDRLMALSGVRGRSVTVLGVSMGGGATLAALPELVVRGVRRAMLFAPASDYAALVGGLLPGGPLGELPRLEVRVVSRALGHREPLALRPAEGLADALVAAPDLRLLVVHGTEDRTIPPALTRALADAHPAAIDVRWRPDAGHAGIELTTLADEAAAREITAFLTGR